MADLLLRLEFRLIPEPSDETIDTEGVRIFVSRDVADLLSDRTLDVDPLSSSAEKDLVVR